MIQKTEPATHPATIPCQSATDSATKPCKSATTRATKPATKDEEEMRREQIQGFLRALRARYRKEVQINATERGGKRVYRTKGVRR